MKSADSPSVNLRSRRSVEFWRGHFHAAHGELDGRATTLEEQHRAAEKRNRESEKQWEAAQKAPTEEAAALAVQMAQLEEQKQKLQRELQKVEATLQKTKKAHTANTTAREAARVEQAASMAAALAVSGVCVCSCMYVCLVEEGTGHSSGIRLSTKKESTLSSRGQLGVPRLMGFPVLRLCRRRIARRRTASRQRTSWQLWPHGRAFWTGSRRWAPADWTPACGRRRRRRGRHATRFCRCAFPDLSDGHCQA